MRLAGFRHALNAFSKKESAASSALGRALLAGDRLALARRGDAVRAELEAANDTAMKALCLIDSDWQKDPRPSDAVERLAALYYQCAYLAKWRAQLAEVIFQFHV